MHHFKSSWIIITLLHTLVLGTEKAEIKECHDVSLWKSEEREHPCDVEYSCSFGKHAKCGQLRPALVRYCTKCKEHEAVKAYMFTDNGCPKEKHELIECDRAKWHST
ncbi:hypothetical protein PGT21_010358 [Puccinia graminis f. sp. tritici]|uniref:Uncharacterized protein n=1 Tax=Puccinia graminis f. sp. tritici TaxID=56615 RepID=A0A5B0S1V4_PUCGR|nr:hypothetical protein PGT21_010358 [Puccinia graminis f. sp. tritici]KAA1131489.1 hypothetical protein PGTUg99_021072 [Puccinia graminis f. sp. tritici]